MRSLTQRSVLVAAGSVILALSVLPITPLAVRGDSYGPFCNFRQVDATGRYYIVVKKEKGGPKDPGRGTPVTFELVERKPGSRSVEPAADEFDFEQPTPNPAVKVRQGDTVLARGKLKRCPERILISSSGLGFVGLDVRGYNYGLRRSGDAVVIVAKDGTVRQRKDLIDLFNDDEISSFLRTAGGVWWLGGGWIDEARREVVVVGSDRGRNDRTIERLFRIVSLDTGKVRPGSQKEIIRALAQGNPGALEFALELTAELELRDAEKLLPPLLANERLPLAVRLRSAVALATLGDRRGGELMTRAALAKGPDQEYAIRYLPDVIRDKAASVLCDAVRRYGHEVDLPAWQAMFAVSSRAGVPELIRLLDEKASTAAQNFAADCLGEKGPGARAAIPSLVKILQREAKTDGLLSTHEHAAIALGRIGPEAKDALPHLIRLAEKHAKEEWDRVKNQQPEAQRDNVWGTRYADDLLVDAICKIRKK